MLRLRDHKTVFLFEKEILPLDCARASSTSNANGRRKNVPNPRKKSAIEIESFRRTRERGSPPIGEICVEEASLKRRQGRFGRSVHRAMLEKRVPPLPREVRLPSSVDKTHERVARE